MAGRNVLLVRQLPDHVQCFKKLLIRVTREPVLGKVVEEILLREDWHTKQSQHFIREAGCCSVVALAPEMGTRAVLTFHVVARDTAKLVLCVHFLDEKMSNEAPAGVLYIQVQV